MERKLKAEVRDGKGKGAARKIRAAGRVPAVVYGHGADPLHVTHPILLFPSPFGGVPSIATTHH